MAEVIRKGGGAMTVRDIEKEDIILKATQEEREKSALKAKKISSGGGGGGGSSSSSSASGGGVSLSQEEENFEEPTPTQIKPTSEVDYSKGLSFGTAARLSLSSLSKGNFRDALSPFQYVGKPRSEEVVYTKIPQGSISPDAPTFQDVTFGDIQFEREAQRRIKVGSVQKKAEQELESYYGGLQSGIDTGKMSYEEAVSLGKTKTQEVQKGFETQVSKIYEAYPDLPQVRERTGSKFGRGLGRGFDIGTDIAAGFFGGPAGFAGISAVKTAISSKEDKTIIRDVVGDGFSMPTYLDTKTSAGTVVRSLGVVVGGGLALKGAGAAVTAGEIEEAVNLQTFYGGVRYKSGDAVLDIVKARGSTGDTLAKSEGILISKAKGSNLYSQGMVDTAVYGKTYFAQKPFILTESQAVSGEGILLPTRGGVTPALTELTTAPNFESAIMKTSKGLNIKASSFETAPITKELVGGLGAEYNGFALGQSGKAFVRRAEAKMFFESEGGRFGEAIANEVRIDFPVESQSVLKIIKQPKGFEKSFEIIGGKGTGTTLRKSFSQQPSFVGASIKQVQKTTSITKGLDKAFGISKGYKPLGTGISLTQEEIKISKVTGFGLKGESLSKQSEKIFEIPKVKTSQIEMQPVKQKSFLGLGLGQFSISRPSQKSLQGIGQVQSLGQPQLEKSIQKQFSLQISTPNITPKPKLSFRGNFRPLFPILPLPGLGFNLGEGTVRKGERTFFYQPSLAALALDIKGAPSEFTITGLALRPKQVRKKRKR